MLSHAFQANASISEGQPFCLRLLQQPAGMCKGPLYKCVQAAPASNTDKNEPLPLQECKGNWRAKDEPALLQDRLQNEIQNSWVKQNPDKKGEAKQDWPQFFLMAETPD